MKIDSAIQTFSEKYDREAISSIDRISSELGLIRNRHTIRAFNITESFNKFCEFLGGYGKYKVDNVGNPEASPQNVICESVASFVNSQLFEATDILYNQIPGFVQGYVTGVQKLMETVDNVKDMMTEAGIDPEYVGAVNDFTDQFMDRLDESFDPAMDRILWASGYNSKRTLFSRGEGGSPLTKKERDAQKVVFV